MTADQLTLLAVIGIAACWGALALAWLLGAAWARILGLPILVAATAFAIWARIALGAIWSAAPTVLEEHKLRTSGPYSVTRHPIYTGLLAMLAGTALLAGGGRWIVAFPVFSCWWRSSCISRNGSCWPNFPTIIRATARGSLACTYFVTA